MVQYVVVVLMISVRVDVVIVQVIEVNAIVVDIVQYVRLMVHGVHGDTVTVRYIAHIHIHINVHVVSVANI